MTEYHIGSMTPYLHIEGPGTFEIDQLLEACYAAALSFSIHWSESDNSWRVEIDSERFGTKNRADGVLAVTEALEFIEGLKE